MLPKENYRFVLEAIDPITECIVNDVHFVVDDLAYLLGVLQIDLLEYREHVQYPIDPDVVHRLVREFELKFEPGLTPVWIRAWVAIDSLPYKVHTGRELLMMLAGKKPLAIFCGPNTQEPCPDDIPEHLFDSYVAEGRFTKHERVYPLNSGSETSCAQLSIRKVAYSLLTEEWRVHAYFLLCETVEKSGWSEGLVRMEGSLLGYEQWQNDAFISMFYQSVHLGASVAHS